VLKNKEILSMNSPHRHDVNKVSKIFLTNGSIMMMSEVDATHQIVS